MLNLLRFTRFSLGVKFGLEDLLRVKYLTFCNSEGEKEKPIFRTIHTFIAFVVTVSSVHDSIGDKHREPV